MRNYRMQISGQGGLQLASFFTFSLVNTTVKTNINYTKLQLVNLCLHIACPYLESYPISPLSYLI